LEIWRQIVNECDCCCQEEKPDEDETFILVQRLKKVSIFYACHIMGAWWIYEFLFKCFQKAKYCISSVVQEVEARNQQLLEAT
jgi:hypothetical protein